VQSELDGLREGLGRLFSGRQPLCRLRLAEQGRPTPVWVNEKGGLIVALMLETFDGPDDDTIRDVKEQELYLGEYASHSVGRWLAYVEGTLRALPVMIEELGGDPAVLLPMDLFAYWKALADPALVTADDFAAALGDPARLAAWSAENVEGEWREALEPCGLAEHVAAVRALLRPSLRLELEREDEYEDEADEVDEDDDEVEYVVGESRFGGRPDLPAGLAWPEVNGRPLLFVAQFDLAEISRYPAARELPRHGLLSFFYDPQGEDDMSHAVRVLHLTDTSALARRTPPAEAEPLPAHTIEFTSERNLPAVESDYFYHSLLPAEQVQPWYARLAAGNGADPPVPEYPLSRLIYGMSERDNARPIHQLLGHPDSIQGDPYLDVEVTTNPGGWDGWRDGTPESQRLRERSLRWRLLLQVDATQDGELLLNQDGGFFYFWIPDDALAARDWSRARGALQCH
jgi:hypothetical protein